MESQEGRIDATMGLVATVIGEYAAAGLANESSVERAAGVWEEGAESKYRQVQRNAC